MRTFYWEVSASLLPDEQYIIKCLSQYGPLAKTQMKRLLYDKPLKTTDKIISNLKNQLMISPIAGGYYFGLDPLDKPDQRMVTAVWVLLRFIGQIEPMSHYPASYPSQIFFLKNSVGYEIMVLFDGEQHLTRLLQPDENMKYIIVLPHIKMSQELKLPNAPCLFAAVDYAAGDEPGITFYSEGGNDGHQ